MAVVAGRDACRARRPTRHHADAAHVPLGRRHFLSPRQRGVELFGEQPRAQKVIAAVAAMAEWEREGRALGLAYSDALGAGRRGFT